MPDSNASNEPSAIDLAREAASQFVDEVNPGGVMTTAVLLYEVSELDPDDGGIRYRVRYAALTDSSMASIYGVINLGAEVFSADCDPKEEDD